MNNKKLFPCGHQIEAGWLNCILCTTLQLIKKSPSLMKSYEDYVDSLFETPK